MTSNVGGLEQNYRLEKRCTERIRRLSVTLCLAKKRHEKNRQKIPSEQLNEALKKGVEDSCRTRNGNKKEPPVQAASTPKKEHKPQNSLSAKVDGLRIIFSNEVPTKARCYRDTETGNADKPQYSNSDAGKPPSRGVFQQNC